MKKIELIIVALAMAFSVVAKGECYNWPDDGISGSDGEIVRGEWNSNFTAGKKYAQEHNLPLLVFWANYDCHYCNWLEKSVTNSAFVTWQKKQQLVMIFAIGQCNAEKKAAYNFADGGRGFAYPIIRVYWPKAEGKTISRAFCGRDGKMIDKSGETLEEQLRNSVDAVLVGYEPTKVGKFAVGGTECDRLEAQIGFTDYVDVPLIRDAVMSDVCATNILTAKFGTSEFTTNFVWLVGQTEQSVRINTKFGSARAGDAIALKLTDFDGSGQTESAITFVDLKDSPANPLWRTERNLETLQYGEWIADIGTATNKVAALKAKGTKAWTLVYSHGSQWCPYCYLNGPSFVETEIFRQWAVDNRVVLVSADMPHNSDSNPDQDWCTIWHRKSEETNLYFDGRGKVPRSGAGYLSRKMISDDDAASMRAQLKELSATLLHLPEDYQASRAIIPGVTILDASGKVVGRLETFDYNMNNHTNGEFAAVYCKRLLEIIKAAETAVDRGSENLNDNCVTTTSTLAMSTTGDSAEGVVSHADYRDVYRLNNVSKGMQAEFKVSGSRNDNIRLCLLKGDRDGNVSDMIKTVTGNLSEGVSIDTTKIAGFAFDPDNSTYFVRVSCHDIMPTTSSNYRPYRLRWGDNEDSETFAGYKATCTESTLAEYAVTATCLFVPTEIKSTYSASADEIMTFSVIEGKNYKFSGVNVPADSFVSLGADLYQATRTACVNAGVGSIAHAVTYQLWQPGEIVFVGGDQRILEREGGGYLTIVRRDGASDECNVLVRVRAGSETNVLGRYEFAATNLIWRSGESGTKIVDFKLIDNGQYDGEGSFIVELVAGDVCAATISTDGEKITVLDTTSPVFDKSSYSVTLYSGFSSDTVFGVQNVGSRGMVKLTALNGSDKLPSGLKFAYDKKTGAVVLSGEPKAKAIGTYEMTYTITQNKDTGYPTTFSVEVKNPADFNSYIGTKWSSLEIPMCVNENGTNFIDGMLTVSITAKNKITAKYTSVDVSSLSFSGMWSTLDEESGEVSTLLQKNGHELSLVLSKEGNLTATMDAESSGEIALEGNGGYQKWMGYYTVSLPCIAVPSGEELCGSGYLTLSMTSSSAASKGLVKYTVVFPKGQSMSGSSTLRRAGDNAYLPIYKRSSKGAVGVMLELSPNGAENWNNAEDVQAREVVRLASEYGAYFYEFARNANKLTYHDVAGSWYPTSALPGDIIKTFYGSEDQPFEVVIDTGIFLAKVGTVVADKKKLVLEDKSSGTSISFNSKTGIFKGKVKISLEPCSVVSGSFTGVLVPGWHKNCDCGDKAVEYPFAAGTFYTKSLSLPVIFTLPNAE